MDGCVRMAKWILGLLLILLICVLGPRCAKSLVIYYVTSGNTYQLRTKAVIRDLGEASLHFHMEYQRFPIPSGPDVMMRSEGVLLLALLGLHEPTNPRKIPFIDLPYTEGSYSGLIDQSGGSAVRPEDWTLLDFWGERYHIILDTNNDGQVPNPESSADSAWLARHPQPAKLKTHSAIFSSGPDRDPKTWEDNICSWR